MSPDPAALYTIVVDPYYPHLVRKLRAEGQRIIGVFSDASPSSVMRHPLPHLRDLDVAYGESGDFPSLVQALRSYRIDRICNGSDVGARLWVKLLLAFAPELAPRPALQFVLCNKFDTANYLREKGVPTGQSYVLHGPPNTGDIARITRDIGFPVVLKPTMSTGGHGVRVCANADELARAAQDVFGTYDEIGTKVEQMVVEERLFGKEYVVCLASDRGAHRLVAAYSYDEFTGYRAQRVRRLNLEYRSQPHIVALQAYAETILEAMEIKYGQFAVEIMLTAEGPRLIELNARFGGFNGLLDEACDRAQPAAEVTVGTTRMVGAH